MVSGTGGRLSSDWWGLMCVRNPTCTNMSSHKVYSFWSDRADRPARWLHWGADGLFAIVVSRSLLPFMASSTVRTRPLA